MKTGPHVAVAIPAFNESDGIGEFLCEIDEALQPRVRRLDRGLLRVYWRLVRFSVRALRESLDFRKALEAGPLPSRSPES